jgi:N-acetylglutamate synthase-like GNAT family acetyltransferase
MITSIRPAEPADATQVFGLLEQFVVSYKPQPDRYAQMFSRLIASPDAYLAVGIVENNVRGYALALRVPTLYANGDLWELQELMVDPDFRSQGIGQSLLDSVIAHAKANGAIEVVVPSRRAGAYYVKHGFTETASYFKLKLTGNP